jgi:hypothetical protein
MHQPRFNIFALVTLIMSQTSAIAAPSPELQQVLQDVSAWIPGNYDSMPQIAYERANGAPPDGEHSHQYRVFARIDAPHLGEYVFYSQIRAGGSDGPIIQQVVFLTEMDEENNGVTFNGRRIKDPDDYIDAHLYPNMWKTIGPDTRFGGNCNFYWRRHGSLLKGTMNDGTCTMMSRENQQMTWHTEWVLSPNELWVYDNGYYDDGSLVTGRYDKSHLRLYKANTFSCMATIHDGGTPDTTMTEVHDRGGVAQIKAQQDNTPPLFLELLRGPTVGEDSEIMETTRLTVLNQDPLDEELPSVLASVSAEGAPSQISVHYSGTEVNCSKDSSTN